MKKIIYLILTLLINQHAFAFGNKYWTGGTSDNWATASNWSTGSVPTINDIAVIDVSATNSPVIYSGTTATVLYLTIHDTDKTLTINNGATLKCEGLDSDHSMIFLIDGGNLINNGTISLETSGGGTVNQSFLVSSEETGSATGYNFTNNGTININTSRYGFSSYITLTTLNITNNGTININNVTRPGFSGEKLSIINNGNINFNASVPDTFFSYYGGSITNNACGKIIAPSGAYQFKTTINDGLMQIGGQITLTSGYSFTNNGILKYGSSTGSGSITNSANGSVIINNSPANNAIFSYGGTFNGIIDGIYTNTATNISAGVFTAPNNFTPSGLSAGLQTLYAKIIPNGGLCSYIVPFSYDYSGEMEVKGNNNIINDGDTSPSSTDYTDFGPQAVSSGSIVKTFTINNTGNASLSLNGTPKVTISGANAADFTVTSQPNSSVVATTGSTTFEITFDPSAGGTRSASISITNDDADENPYSFDIQGTGLTTCSQVATSTQLMTWAGTVSNDWSDPCNWSPNGVPSATNPVKINIVTNAPVVNSTTAVAKNIEINGVGVSLTINTGGVLTISTAESNTLQLINSSFINRGTLNLSNTRGNDMSYAALLIDGTAAGENYGVVSISSPNNRGLVLASSGSFTNKTGATLTINAKQSIIANSTNVLTNEAGATISGSGTQNAITLASGSISNYGSISFTGENGCYAGTSLTNYACATFKNTADFYIYSPSTIINSGYMEVGGILNTSATFNNNGILKYGTLNASGNFNNNTNTSVIVRNLTTPIFAYGGSFNGTINGIFTDADATISAGTFTAPNTFVPNGNVVAGSQTLYVKITPNGGACSYIVPFTYLHCTTTAVINYAGTPYCKTASPIDVTLTGTTGGAFTSAPAGLTINSSSGQITPSSSTAGSYTITYTIAASGGCASTTATTSVTITNNPTATISYVGTPYCKTASPANVTLTGSSGGTFTSAPVGLTINSSSGQITPSSSTAGSYTVTYTIAASGGCASATATTSVTITDNPTATITYAGSPFCKTASPGNVTLTGTAGGTFTSTPAGLIIDSSSGQITPSSSTARIYIVTYTIAASGGCGVVTATTGVWISENPTATISYAETPYCKTASPANVTRTGFPGGTFTSAPAGMTINSSSGQITPSSSTAGTYTVAYTIAASLGCAAVTATTSVTITDNPSATISYAGTPYCKTASPANVTLTGSSGGTFTSLPAGLTINSSSGQITPSSSTAGSYTVTYTIAASGGCASATATTSVTITNNPSATISYTGTPYCKTASPANATLTGSSGGTFASAPVGLTINPSSGQITPSSSTAGSYTVTYTIAASGGCASATATTSVTITNNPSATISYAGTPYCKTASPANVTLTGSSGGIFTSLPAGLTINPSSGQITPSSSTAGSYTVTYTIAASGGCASATATTSVTITNNPSATISYAGTPYCKSSSPANVTLTGSSGGTFASAPVGLTINPSSGQITPSSSTAGSYTVTYTIAASGGCASATATTSVTITNNPTATISYAGTPYCKTANPDNVTLTGSSDGTFTSAPVGLTINPSSGQITPSSSTAGSYTVTYTIAASGGCASATATTSVTITNNPTATISYAGTPYCKSSSPANVTLIGSSGGTFASAPVGLTINPSSGQITPSSSTAGSYTVTYTIAASGGCASATATTSVTITNNPTATISYAGTPYCKTASPANVTLTGSSGGTFASLPAGLTINSSSGQITPSSSTAGSYTVTYTIAASGGCASATATTSVTITNNPSATISYAGTPYCKTANPDNVNLTGSSGGIFTSLPAGLTINPSSGQITPSSSTAGSYTVTYTIAAIGGCASATATTSVTITNNPSATISYTGTPYCKTASPANATLIGSSGGTFASAPVGLTINPSSGQITPSSSTAGSYTVTYTIAASGGCASATATTSVTITNNPSATISYAGTPYCKTANPANATLTGSSGGTFVSAPVGLTINPSSGQITPSSSTAGSYTVTYTIAAIGGCASATATTSVTITNNPSATISYAGTPYCKTASPANVTLIGSSGGTFASAPVGLTINPSSGQITPSSSTAGSYTVTYTIAAIGGCASATATTSVTITNNPSATISYAGTPYCKSSSPANVTLTGSSGGTFTSLPAGLTINSSSGQITLSSSTAGSYTVTYTIAASGGCASATATTSVTITNNPSATISYAGTPYCKTASLGNVILTGSSGGTFTSLPAGLTINSSSGQITPSSSTAGSYTVTYTIAAIGGCASATATTSVTITNNPNVSITGSANLDCITTSVTRTAIGENGGASLGYVWSNGLGANAIANINSPGIYTVTVTGDNGCTATATTSVTIDNTVPNAPGITAPSTKVACSPSTLVLIANGCAGTINWSNGSSGTSITLSSVGTYSISATCTVGSCTSVSSAVVTGLQIIVQPPAPIITAPITKVVCSPNTLTLTANGCAGTINWSNGSSGTSITLSSIGTYSISATCTVGSCTSISSAVITGLQISIPPIVSIIGNDNLSCSVVSVTRTASGNGVSPAYQWTNNLGTNALANITSPGTYTVTMTSNNGCTATATTTVTKDINTPTASITGSDNLTCTTTTVTRTASGGGSYIWSNSLGPNAIANITSPGIYTVTITGSNGCTATATTSVTQNLSLTANASNTGPYTIGQTIQLNGLGNGGASPDYIWNGPAAFSSSSQSPAILNALSTNSGTYTLTVVSGICTATATTSVIVSGIDPCTQIVNLQYVKAGDPYQDMFSLNDGMVIQQIPEQVSIIANPICPSVSIGSVDLTISGPEINWTILQNVQPYAVFDNLALNVYGRNFIPGIYTMTVTGYAEDNRLGGTVYGPVTTTFTIVGTMSIINAPTIQNNRLCAGSTVDVTFATTGSFDPINRFNIQLSDSTGGFNNPVLIGTSTTAGTITCQLPQNLSATGKYLIRVASSNQVVASNPTMQYLSVIPASRNLTSNINTGTITEQASIEINADNKISAQTIVTYNAGKAIVLNPGFEARDGSIFKAQIQGCGN